jgi:hypothetical protein
MARAPSAKCECKIQFFSLIASLSWFLTQFTPTTMSFLKTIIALCFFASATLATTTGKQLRGLQVKEDTTSCPSVLPAPGGACSTTLSCSYNYQLFPKVNPQGKCTGNTYCQAVEHFSCSEGFWLCSSLGQINCGDNFPAKGYGPCEPSV